MGTKKLRESFASPLAGCRVDREAGIIFGALVCGFQSANGRDYPWGGALTHRKGTYEGKPVNIDHGRESTVDRRFGWLANETTGPDGRPRADVHVLTSHPMAARVLEAAERNPSLFGLSHVAVCRTRPVAGGREVIEDVTEVESVDIVASPATTKGLFEGTMPTTLKTFLEAVGTRKPAAAKWSRAKWVREMDEMMGGEMDLPPPPPADMPEPDADEATTNAFKAAISAVVDKAMSGGMDPKEALSKIKTLLRSHGDINGDGTVDGADIDAADDAEPVDAAPAEELEKAESRGIEKGKALVYESLKTAVAVGLPADPDTLRLIDGIPADRITALLSKKLTEAKPVAEKPRTTPRTTTVTESKTAGGGMTDEDVKAAVAKFRRA